MKVDVTESKKNDLLGRTEISCTITFEGPTPKRYEVLKAVAAATKSKEDLTVVKQINTHYGGGVADVTAFAYSDKALFEKVEREYMRTRNAKVEEPAPEAPAEEAGPEAPVEEAKEEPAEDAPTEKKEEGE